MNKGFGFKEIVAVVIGLSVLSGFGFTFANMMNDKADKEPVTKFQKSTEKDIQLIAGSLEGVIQEQKSQQVYNEKREIKSLLRERDKIIERRKANRQLPSDEYIERQIVHDLCTRNVIVSGC